MGDEVLDVSSPAAREATIAALVTSGDSGKRVFGRLLATGIVSSLDEWVTQEAGRGSSLDDIGRAIMSMSGGALGNIVANTQVRDLAHVERLAKVAGEMLSEGITGTAIAARAMRGLPPL